MKRQKDALKSLHVSRNKKLDFPGLPKCRGKLRFKLRRLKTHSENFHKENKKKTRPDLDFYLKQKEKNLVQLCKKRLERHIERLKGEKEEEERASIAKLLPIEGRDGCTKKKREGGGTWGRETAAGVL